MEILIDVLIFVLLTFTIPCIIGYFIAVLTGSNILAFIVFVVLVVGERNGNFN